MLFLNASMTETQPDYVALGMILVLLLVVAVMAIRKSILLKKASAPVAEQAAAAPVSTVVAPGTAGELKLHDVDPKSAAMIMAIVADKAGKPLNELRFISIKEVK